MTKQLKATSVKSEEETPRIPEAALTKNEVMEQDSLGRNITLKKPTPFQKFDLARILGDNATNQAYYGQCFILMHVVKIDEDDCFFETASEMKALIQQLGDEGMEKSTEMFVKHFNKEPSAGAKEQVKK